MSGFDWPHVERRIPFAHAIWREKSRIQSDNIFKRFSPSISSTVFATRIQLIMGKICKLNIDV